MTRSRYASALCAALVCGALGLSACGEDDEGGGGGGAVKYGTGAPVEGKKGGTLQVMSNGDVDYVDPGAAYYQFSFILMYATHRPLFSYKPEDAAKAVPDMAASEPEVSTDGKTITIKVRQGVKFSPPVNREVTSKDVKYAIERGFNPHVANGYTVYLSDIIGADKAKGGPIPGIETPDDQTIVFKLKRATAASVIGALSLPLSAPVPKEYAKKYDDRKTPNQYGFYQVATGPYMIQNNAAGKATGYVPSRRITLVRNPNWDASTDYRPAYLDKIIFNEGNSDLISTARKIVTGANMVNGQGDFNVPPTILKSLSKGPQTEQLIVGDQTGRVRYVALNTKVKPFDDVNVRKAVAAGLDRNAMRLAMGGPLTGDTPTHFLPATIPGHEEAGGAKGPGFDFLANPSGDPELAASYLKKAGFSSGKYTGGETLQMVADNASPLKDVAQVVQSSLTKLGFKTKLALVTRDTMYTKFCNVPARKVEICPNVGWLKDFPDPASMLVPTFKGAAIVPTNNSNWPQLDVKAIDDAMTKADPITDPAQRAAAWGQIDKDITAQAPGVPWLFDKGSGIRSENVNGVINQFNAAWDLSASSIK